jgi:pimeloyl-ACP methyl ester carboxylesterase
MPLVLLHAFPVDSRMWRPQKPFNAISPEILGIASIDDAADHVARLLDQRGIDRAVVGGLSRGGYIALAFARRHPDRLSALVLCDTNAGLDDDQAKRGRYQMAERIGQEGIGFVPDIMLPRLLGDTSFRERAELVEEVRTWILDQDPGAVSAATIGMAERADSRPMLNSIKVPVLAIAGQQDSAHETTRAIAEGVRDGRFVSIPRAGHLSNLEQPEKFNAALRQFLEEHKL